MASLEDKLLAVASLLSKDEREQLLAYAEFLEQRSDHAKQRHTAEPVHIPRPDSESVVAAMRRLADTYPMLNKDRLLHEAAGLMSEHVMQGKPAEPVIDELEILFERHYRVHLGRED
jgi:hypothetical protein